MVRVTESTRTIQYLTRFAHSWTPFARASLVAIFLVCTIRSSEEKYRNLLYNLRCLETLGGTRKLPKLTAVSFRWLKQNITSGAGTVVYIQRAQEEICANFRNKAPIV